MKKENGVLTEVTIEDLEILKTNPKKFWEGVETIGKLAFSNYCKHNIEEIEIPDSVKSIERFAFYECDVLKKVILPKNLKTIEKNTFYGCLSLEEIEIPKSVEDIEMFAFYVCVNLKNVNIAYDSRLKTIQYAAFDGCEKLTEITFPYNINYIAEGAFHFCFNLNKIEFTNRIPNIDLGAFEHQNINVRFDNRNRKMSPNTLAVMFKDGKLKEKFKDEAYYQVEDVLKFVPSTIYNNSLKKYVNFCSQIGALEPKSTSLELNGNSVPASNLAYYFLKEANERNNLSYRALPLDNKYLEEQNYNENFLRYLINEENWSDIKIDQNFLSKVTERFAECEKTALNEESESSI